MRKPDFAVVGTQKAATTWLFECLDEHPEVFVPRLKEVHYFCPADQCRVSRADQGLDWYLSLFPEDPKYKAVGELTTDYMLWEQTAAQLAAFNPNLKIIFLLRHPVERAYSAYWMWRRHTPDLPPFRQVLEQDSRFLERGFYHQQIERYRQAFPDHQIKVYIYEELVSNPDHFFDDLYQFLGVDRTFRPLTMNSKVGETKQLPGGWGRAFYKWGSALINLKALNPIWRYLRRRFGVKEMVSKMLGHDGKEQGYPPMSTEDRQYLTQVYREETEALYRLLGREILAWKK